MPNEQEYFSASEAAEYLNLSRQRINYLAMTGRMGRRLGGFWFFTKEELDRFNQERAQRPKGGPRVGKDGAGTLARVSPAVVKI